jgi:DNA-binding transcriptional MocR family regulator
VQLMTWQLLHAWGDEGLERHVRQMQGEYARRAAILHEAAQRELAGLAEWERPTAGMFMVGCGGLPGACTIRISCEEAVLLAARLWVRGQSGPAALVLHGLPPDTLLTQKQSHNIPSVP